MGSKLQTSTIGSEFGGGSAFWDGRLRPSGYIFYKMATMLLEGSWLREALMILLLNTT
ncbi:MAG: hypothetical protein IPN86_22865 [Saprospiraceae bacterium]|nr:hypothetical protein [Saprospiraceae bacterium]